MKKTIVSTIILSFVIFSLVFIAGNGYAAQKTNPPIPDTISKEAQEMLFTLYEHTDPPVSLTPDDYEGWKNLQDTVEEIMLAESEQAKKDFDTTLEDVTINGVDALKITPKDLKNDQKILLYVHGGAYVLYSAHSTLFSSIPTADLTGLQVIAVDYTLSPHVDVNTMIDQVIDVYDGLLEQGYDSKDIAIYGDSAGGGLTTATVLKLRELNKPLPSAVVLWSPWTDIGMKGDSYITMKDFDPTLEQTFLKMAAKTHAPDSEHTNPYVSPVYGNYEKEFPPTLIQAGTREILLSDSVRLYQKMKKGNKDVTLDIYEGMWHVSQAYYRVPEAVDAKTTMNKFLEKHLLYTE
jgi:acetyl esterase/lipase